MTTPDHSQQSRNDNESALIIAALDGPSRAKATSHDPRIWYQSDKFRSMCIGPHQTCNNNLPSYDDGNPRRASPCHFQQPPRERNSSILLHLSPHHRMSAKTSSSFLAQPLLRSVPEQSSKCVPTETAPPTTYETRGQTAYVYLHPFSAHGCAATA